MNQSTRLSMNSELTHMNEVFVYIVVVAVVVVSHLVTCQTIYFSLTKKFANTYSWLTGFKWLGIQNHAHMTVKIKIWMRKRQMYAIFCISSLYSVCYVRYACAVPVPALLPVPVCKCVLFLFCSYFISTHFR